MYKEFPHKFYSCLFKSHYINFHFQSWGDHTDTALAVMMYIVVTGSVSLYCWLSNELSEQVRKIVLSNQIWMYLFRYFHTHKYSFSYVTCNIRNISPDICLKFVSDIICRLSEHSLSDFLRNLRSTKDVCNINTLCDREWD
jgi:hypothetical protein